MPKMSDKWAKSTLCDFRAAWSGVFSIPGGTTGPGFKAEIRPPLFSLFFDQNLMISVFCILWILIFLTFLWSDIFHILWSWPFLWCSSYGVIRPYCNGVTFVFTFGEITQGSLRVMCGGSPLISQSPFLLFLFLFVFVCRGDSQERRYRILYSRSPLCILVSFTYRPVSYSSRGDSQERRSFNLTLVLPSMKPKS